jgi:hypothetical protein
VALQPPAAADEKQKKITASFWVLHKQTNIGEWCGEGL